jgi:hypothetical protein
MLLSSHFAERKQNKDTVLILRLFLCDATRSLAMFIPETTHKISIIFYFWGIIIDFSDIIHYYVLFCFKNNLKSFRLVDYKLKVSNKFKFVSDCSR